MKQKKSISMISLAILLIILAVGGVTYAFFTATITNGDRGSSVIVQTGTLRLVYSDTEYINVSGVLPGSTYTKTVTVTNEGNVPVYYDLVWIELLNELVTKNDLTMEISCSSNTDTCEGLGESTVANSGANIPILYHVEIGMLETHTFVITLNFKETGSNQNDNQGKNITGKIGIIESGTFTTDLYGYVYDENSSVMPNVVVELHSDPVSVLTDANGRYEFDSIPLGTHTAYVKTSDKTSTIMTSTMTIKYGKNKSIVGTNATIMKSNNAIIGVNIYKTVSTPILALSLPSGILKGTNGGMYQYAGEYYASKYKSMITSITIDNKINIPGDAISTWDVSSNTNGSVMAYIKSDNVSGYQLHIQAQDGMYAAPISPQLFMNFYKVTTITGLENLNISKTISIEEMFGGCSSLTTLDLSTFDTSSMRYIGFLFHSASSLTTIYLNNATLATNIIGYGQMFYGITSGITIHVKDSTAKTFINARLADVSKTGTVIID